VALIFLFPLSNYFVAGLYAEALANVAGLSAEALANVAGLPAEALAKAGAKMLRETAKFKTPFSFLSDSKGCDQIK
jgi:hypothetical protein